MEAAVVTVLMSTYDGARFLDAQLESLVAQSERRWQLYVVDDGSSDGTPDVVRSWADRDERVVPISDARPGRQGPAARYLGLLAHVTTPWWAFCDQDDIWTPDHLAVLLASARRWDPGAGAPHAVCADAAVVDRDRRPVLRSAMERRRFAEPKRDRPEVELPSLLLHNTAIGMTMLGNRTLARQAAAAADDPDVAMHDWFVACLAAATGRLSYLGRVTAEYRQHDANVTGVPASRSARLKLAAGDGLAARTDRIVGRAARNARALHRLLESREPAAGTVEGAPEPKAVSVIARLAALSDGPITPASLLRLHRAGVRQPGLGQQLLLLVGAIRRTRRAQR